MFTGRPAILINGLTRLARLMVNEALRSLNSRTRRRGFGGNRRASNGYWPLADPPLIIAHCARRARAGGGRNGSSNMRHTICRAGIATTAFVIMATVTATLFAPCAVAADKY